MSHRTQVEVQIPPRHLYIYTRGYANVNASLPSLPHPDPVLSPIGPAATSRMCPCARLHHMLPLGLCLGSGGTHSTTQQAWNKQREVNYNR